MVSQFDPIRHLLYKNHNSVIKIVYILNIYHYIIKFDKLLSKHLSIQYKPCYSKFKVTTITTTKTAQRCQVNIFY